MERLIGKYLVTAVMVLTAWVIARNLLLSKQSNVRASNGNLTAVAAQETAGTWIA